MALTPERIMELSDRLLRVVGAGYVRPQDADGFARAIESEVRKDDTELIRQLVEALKVAVLQNDCDMVMTGEELRQSRSAINAARARLQGKI